MGSYVLFVLTAGAYLPSPLYPGYQQAFGASDLTMTVVYAVFALVSAPALLLFGAASDALGPRPLLRCGLALAALGSGCLALAPDVRWLVVARAAQGLALGAVTGAAALLGSQRPDGQVRGGAVRASVAFVTGTATGAVAGGLSAEYAAAPRVVPFVMHLGLLAVGWWLVAALPRCASRGARWRPNCPQVPRGMRPLFASAAAAGFLAWTAAGLFLAVLPTLMERAQQANSAVVGSLLGAVLVASAVTQPLISRLGVRRAQLVGLCGVLVGLGILGATVGSSTSLTLTAALCAGVGHGLAYGGAAAAVDARAPRDQRGALTGALHLAFYLGAGCPAIAVGLLTLGGRSLAEATSLLTAVAAALVPLAGIAVALSGRRTPSSSERVVVRHDGDGRELPRFCRE